MFGARRQAILTELVRGAEGDQPEEEPQRAHARQREQGAVSDGAPEREEGEQVKSRQRPHGGGYAEKDQPCTAENGGKFHDCSMCDSRAELARRAGSAPGVTVSISYSMFVRQ